ncbi:DUF4268 domain-containing protein [Maribellus sediminis]|uniref:DUF4268 domain-containing protein n=1 Tax=Maribellus sediminis TaxID=2696285 RepID=UPI00142F5B5B|nr:DUF4268 domain-containing protein [Maribellus sediminis]
MYSKEELKQLNINFWTKFGQFCDVHPELRHKKRKWMLHRTKVKDVAFRFEAGRKNAKVILELGSRNENQRFKAYEFLERYKVIMEEGFEDGLTWEFFHEREDSKKQICRIYTVLEGVDLHRQNQWPEIFSFYIENMAKLEDNFLMIRDLLIEELKSQN